MKVAVTGHRPNKLGGYGPSKVQDRVRGQLRMAFEKLRATQVISGMALGVDQWAAEEALDLWIPVLAAVPFEGQQRLWPLDAQRRYRGLLSQASEIVHVCDPGYAVWKMQKRNEWMVDHCRLLVAVWDGTRGGTANCVRYAERVGCSVLRIPVL